MPSTTFYNLPAEKRERLLSAARAEFARAPYEEASVNRMIRAAGIPRGSFYMYFTDKEELFRFLMETYSGMLSDWMGTQLVQNGGDLFAAFLALFDFIQANRESVPFQELAAILHRNRQMQPGLLLEGLLRGTLLNPEASAEMLSILRNQRLNGKMPFYLHSRGVPVAHKTGEDDGITHDVGIVYAAHPLALCFAGQRTDVPAFERLMQDMSRAFVDSVS